MSLELDLNDAGAISVIIKDNGGGFPDNYIKNFPAYIADHGYKKRSISDADNAGAFTSGKENIGHYYFGGAGKGLAIILNLLLTGHLLEGPNQLKALYEVAENATAVSLGNCMQGDKIVGAKLKFTSPITPFSPPLALPQESFTISKSLDFTLLAPPVTRKKPTIELPDAPDVVTSENETPQIIK
ncbi:hypothetical protein [Legionella tunisiensis]|uniref:hypothetical protein n=1 Tax=Legionella tunisiensis TaxID=1034944 RepID=UPI0002F89D1A|nr:hypothetical protein [Legionella tunisiensis]